MTNKEYNKRSICETSMLVVANIIRLSSLRFSGQSEGTHVVAKGNKSSISKIYKSERTQEMDRTKGPRSYLIKPPKEDPTTYVNRAFEDVDINAQNYINHVRCKIRDTANIQH
ncbi:uncharacterized protein LOC124820369 [Vigna umbellata]|uniref:Uncharacterized protein n=2 Tax=Phaseolus angularis TaxID=3914 RepID=A0A0L9TCH8_PHAAN|nr:uncharacterized protein LOC124820369 [Vigna umbellata]XP_052727514.1 uncharacterized protein LOC128194954 [Vigna angularis]KOM28227.1 hypothetical protein LR48_Vigan511s005000 [Vigna angularis]BAT74611.1 hypothetical protein VIGAN_01231400 [Vigna angularis var. angularis]